MPSLIAAAVAFTALHLLVSGTGARDRIVGAIGERPYQGLFSLASAAALGWLIVAYVRVRVPEVTPLAQFRGAADGLVLIAFLFIVLGLLSPKTPTIVGGEKFLKKAERAADLTVGIHRVTRHPYLWGVALWATVHAVFNPGLPHLVFFGTFAVVSLAGTVSIDRKRQRALGEAWERYAALTSNAPFLAIARGRNRFVVSELGWAKLVAALLVYAAFAVFHARLFGVPAV